MSRTWLLLLLALVVAVLLATAIRAHGGGLFTDWLRGLHGH